MSGFPGGASGKEPACKCRRCKRGGFISYPNMIAVQFCKKKNLVSQRKKFHSALASHRNWIQVAYLLPVRQYHPCTMEEFWEYLFACVCVCVCVCMYVHVRVSVQSKTLFSFSLFPQNIFPLSQSCFICLFCSVFLTLYFLVTEENISQNHGGIDLYVLFSTDAED